MKKLFSLLIVMILLAATAWADTKMSAFTTKGTPTTSDYIVGLDAASGNANMKFLISGIPGIVSAVTATGLTWSGGTISLTASYIIPTTAHFQSVGSSDSPSFTAVSATTFTGALSGNATTATNGVVTTGSYSNPAWITSLAASKVGLGSVENTALSTWAGTANITTLGTIATGTIPDSHISYASKTANYIMAAPVGSSGTPTFRAMVATDVPTLNQDTTGTAANLSGTPALPDGTTATTQTVGDGSTKLATMAAVAAAVRTYRIPHGFTELDAVDARTFPGFFISLPSGQSAKLVSCRYAISGGTSVAAKLTKNGSDATGFTGISVTPTPASTTPTAVTLTDGDFIALVTSSPTGSPLNLSFTAFVEYTR